MKASKRIKKASRITRKAKLMLIEPYTDIRQWMIELPKENRPYIEVLLKNMEVIFDALLKNEKVLEMIDGGD